MGRPAGSHCGWGPGPPGLLALWGSGGGDGRRGGQPLDIGLACAGHSPVPQRVPPERLAGCAGQGKERGRQGLAQLRFANACIASALSLNVPHTGPHGGAGPARAEAAGQALGGWALRATGLAQASSALPDRSAPRLPSPHQPPEGAGSPEPVSGAGGAPWRGRLLRGSSSACASLPPARGWGAHTQLPQRRAGSRRDLACKGPARAGTWHSGATSVHCGGPPPHSPHPLVPEKGVLTVEWPRDETVAAVLPGDFFS